MTNRLNGSPNPEDEITRLRAEVERLTARNQRYLDRNIVFSQEVTRLRRIIDPLFDDEEAEHEPGCGINATPCYPAGICTCKYSLHSLFSAEITALRATNNALKEQIATMIDNAGKVAALRAEVERLTAALTHADEQAAKVEARIWPTAELNATLRATNDALKEKIATMIDNAGNVANLRAKLEHLCDAAQAVIRVADRATIEFDGLKAAIASAHTDDKRAHSVFANSENATHAEMAMLREDRAEKAKALQSELGAFRSDPDAPFKQHPGQTPEGLYQYPADKPVPTGNGVSLDPDRLMIDPPSGWRYGFPKRIPREHQHRTLDWLIDEGYPERLTKGKYFYCRYWNEVEGA